ncbi:hypothetical protein [Bosea sp. BK604]|uniref:hypothetical protein n=1 Tax=Bosea sp. BK604 TaxID=2512180 RepID=UPI0010513612|nr:hypothetical protein [Bosea sp. BK604]TCR62204.1 hypothetical protein EV560_111192 [Bosea sp. BK604]
MSVLASWQAWRRRDGFTAWYFVWFFALLLFLASLEELDVIFSLYILLAPLVLALALPAILLLLFALGRDIALRRWRRLASWILGLLIAVGLVSALVKLGFDPTWARFALTRERYDRVVAALPRDDVSPRFKAFDWGDSGGAGVTNLFRRLIYDESGEIVLEPDQRSLAWRDRLLASEDGKGVLRQEARGLSTLRHVSGHFYLMTGVYQ